MRKLVSPEKTTIFSEVTDKLARMIFSILTSDYYLFHWYIYICKSKHCTIIKTLGIILLFYIFKKSIKITFTQIFQIIYIRQQNLTCEKCDYHTQVNTLIIGELRIATVFAHFIAISHQKWIPFWAKHINNCIIIKDLSEWGQYNAMLEINDDMLVTCLSFVIIIMSKAKWENLLIIDNVFNRTSVAFITILLENYTISRSWQYHILTTTW